MSDSHGAEAPPIVAIFRSTLLAASEGFITRQAEAVPGVVPFYFGLRRLAGAAVPADRVRVSSWRPEVMRKALFVIGRDPVFNRALRQVRPDLIHAHFGPDAAMLLPAARRLRLPLVVTFHGYDVMTPDAAFRSGAGRLWLRRRARVFEQAALLLAVSDAVRARLIELGAPPHKVIRHYIGVDHDVFDRAVFGAATPDGAVTDRDRAHVLFVGRLTEVKGVDDLLQAIAVVRATVPSVTVTIVGDGPLRATLEARAAELALPVVFVESVSQRELAGLMARATLLCAPSKVTGNGQREAFGLVLAEAQAAGLPVVAYRSGGTGEALTHGVGGLLVDEGDVAALATALTALLSDPDQREAFGAAGRDDARRRFDLRTQSRQLGELYRSVIPREPADLP